MAQKQVDIRNPWCLPRERSPLRGLGEMPKQEETGPVIINPKCFSFPCGLHYRSDGGGNKQLQEKFLFIHLGGRPGLALWASDLMRSRPHTLSFKPLAGTPLPRPEQRRSARTSLCWSAATPPGSSVLIIFLAALNSKAVL